MDLAIDVITAILDVLDIQHGCQGLFESLGNGCELPIG